MENECSYKNSKDMEEIIDLRNDQMELEDQEDPMTSYQSDIVNGDIILPETVKINLETEFRTENRKRKTCSDELAKKKK